MAYLSLSSVMAEMAQAENEAKRNIVDSFRAIDLSEEPSQQRPTLKDKPGPQTTSNFAEILGRLQLNK